MRCDLCEKKSCGEGKPCVEKPMPEAYSDPAVKRLMRAASEIEAEHYGMMNRLQEIMEFARKMGWRKIGLAFCMGLAEEARAAGEILSMEFEIESACCKIGGLAKKTLGMAESPELMESSCNPAGQAAQLESAGCDLAIVMGLCVGHDTVFYRTCSLPVTTLAVKDRVLGHNPLAAVTCPYVKKRVIKELKAKKGE
ncbi:MAG: DUF1847 domain-containing protein [Synergistales bacterium]